MTNGSNSATGSSVAGTSVAAGAAGAAGSAGAGVAAGAHAAKTMLKSIAAAIRAYNFFDFILQFSFVIPIQLLDNVGLCCGQ
jgi:hypothetical protein